MELKKVIAIFDSLKLDDVENALLSHGVRGFTLQEVRGRGAYFDSFNKGKLAQHIQMEIYTRAECAEAVAKLILDIAHAATDSEGLVAIEPAEALFWINTKAASTKSDLRFLDSQV